MPHADADLIREGELARLKARFAEARAGQPRFVLVRGEAGMGKTTLLGRFLTGVRDALVLRASGDESESLLRYSVVEQLVPGPATPTGVLADLRDRSLPSPEPFEVGAALLAHLDGMQQRRPVAVVIDDAHHADVASQLALLFALRRLHAARVLVVLATELRQADRLVEGLQKVADSTIGSRMDLSGLGLTDVKKLARAVGGRRPLSRRFVEHLREHTGGNPFHIRRVLEELGDDAADHPSHVPLPAPASISVPVVARLEQCPPESRRLVAAAAVVGMRCPFGLVRRLAAVEHPLVALQAGVESRLIAYRSRDVAFVDPLVRAAVYHSLPISEQAGLHAGAADLVPDEATRLRHLASAATEDDETLAETIAAFARRESRLGAWVSASASFVEAANLAPHHRARERYVREAIECQLTGGDLVAAEALVMTLNGVADSADGLYVRGRLARMGGRPDEAEALLDDARRACGSEASVLAARIAVERALLFASLLRPAESTACAEAAVSTARDGRTPDLLPAAAIGLAVSGRAEQALRMLASLPHTVGPAVQESPDFLFARALARLHAGADGAPGDAKRLVAVTRRREQRLMQVWGLATLALCEYRVGNWDEAVDSAELGITLGEEADLVAPLAVLHSILTWPLAGRGQWSAAEAHAARARELARSPLDLAVALIARAVVADARSQYADVSQAVVDLRSVGCGDALDVLDGLFPWRALAIEAAVASGRLDEASTELQGFEAAVGSSTRAAADIVMARLLGGLEAARGNDRAAHAAFARAAILSNERTAPFERAMAQAAHGAFLRRAGQRRPAVGELRAARDGFDRLGAAPYVERCERELAASGLAPRRRREVAPIGLTPQERSVAQLVAQGKSNRTVAEELVVSVNTIEYHLKNIYAKLGIRSRSQLTLRLATSGGDFGIPGPPP